MNQQTGGRKKLSNHHTPAKEPFTAGPPQCLSTSVEESGTSADRRCHHPAVWDSEVVKHLPASGCCYAAARRAQLSGCRSARCRGIISDKITPRVRPVCALPAVDCHSTNDFRPPMLPPRQDKGCSRVSRDLLVAYVIYPSVADARLTIGLGPSSRNSRRKT